MNRRAFLSGLVSAGALSALPNQAYAAATSSKVLILIELKGGNDGLNTVIPYADPLYRSLRPRIGLQRDEVIPLDEALGMNSAMQALNSAWQSRDMAWVLGVGYEHPNRSHFRSIEIWETASDANEYRQQGWISPILPRSQGGPDGIVLDRGGSGPLMGSGGRSVVMDSPERFLQQARGAQARAQNSGNPALAHLLSVESGLSQSAQSLARSLSAVAKPQGFPKGKLAKRLQNAARLAALPSPPAVIKLSHGSFDTHANQRRQQDRLLKELAEGLAALRTQLKAQGIWDDTLVMTYSEFGRRPKENGSRGTDHGTAAPHLMMGGSVKGGLYGKQPSLNRLANQDLQYTVDYRQLYATVAREWWGVRPGDSRFRPMGILG